MQLSPRRLFFGTSTALVLAAIGASMLVTRVSSTISARRQAEQGAVRLGVLIERNDTTRALALSYLERARLGLGSPFRLIDQAARDPRLADSVRRNVALAIVDRLFDAKIYEIDSRALDVISQPGMGAGYLRIIEEALERTDDPRVGEAAVRIAFGLAASGGSTSLTSLPVAAEAAAQVRDRILAGRDIHFAVARAREDRSDLIQALIRLRATRQLSVEQPTLGALTAADREKAIDLAPSIVEQIGAVRPVERTDGRPTLLDRKAAATLARLAAAQPPLAAIRIPVTGRAATLRADSALARSVLPVIAAVANEESLVAAYAYAEAASAGPSATLSRLMVSSAVALRPHAQDPVWFGNAPTVGAVVGRYALKGITFDRDVPRAWQPFYAHMIAGALDDFTRAVPGYDPAGLSFRVEMGSLPDSALAMHDPRTHTIRLSALTPSGTLAHELAHDIDWQAARRLFAKSGGYASDRSQRERALRLSSSVRGLTTARIAGRGRISPHGSSRPAEFFARSVDWFVADRLAADGRSNGFLSAIEDQLLSGFATSPADAPSLETARALVGTLAEMTFVPDSSASAYMDRWSSLDALDPSTIVLRTIDAPVVGRRGTRSFFGVSRETAAELSTSLLCQVETLREGSPQERLMAMAIDARARGIVVRRTRYSPSQARVESDLRLTAAGVAEGFARAGLIELAPPPFRPRCN